MKLKKTIRKALIIAAWLVVCSGMLTLLIAANKEQEEHTCKKVVVTIKGANEKFYIDKSDIIRQLQTALHGKLIDQPVKNFDLSALENVVKTNAWITDADMYFDSQDVLNILVIEKEPIARVFTTAGTSFYIDSSARPMPLLEKWSIRLPVFTNYPVHITTKPKDSTLLAGVKSLALFIDKDSFWSSQIAQVNILEEANFEAVPTIGNHIIKIGTADNIGTKFSKLLTFYQMVLSKTGFDKYSVVDIQFNNQVVATHKGAGIRIDSTQLQHNMEALMKKSQLEAAAVVANSPDNSNHIEKRDTVTASRPVLKTITPAPVKRVTKTEKKTVASKPIPTPVKTKLQAPSKENKKKNEKESAGKKPKAIMQNKVKKNEY